MDKIVAAKADLKLAQEMAFKVKKEFTFERSVTLTAITILGNL